MDARSIAATAINKGKLTPATELDVNYTRPEYHFNDEIYKTVVILVLMLLIIPQN